MRSSPQAWGCFQIEREGVCRFSGLPHRRGDVSMDKRYDGETVMSSPQAWGCFYDVLVCVGRKRVFPTGVGMFLHNLTSHDIHVRLPHRRGDVSVGRVHPGLVPQSSPRAWGCFLFGVPATGLSRVFPTGVGMFPCNQPLRFSKARFPHGCGDVSDIAR